jgi:hypothetical protein
MGASKAASLLRLLTLVIAAVGVACSRGAHPLPGDHRVLGADLEPLRSDFNAAVDHVRAVLLVGPT